MMCGDETAFIAAIRAAPDDDAPRLVFADWLDENRQPERAEFIRVQIAIAQLGLQIGPRARPGPDGHWVWDSTIDQLQAREKELLHLSPHYRVFPQAPHLGERCNLWHWMGSVYFLAEEGSHYEMHAKYRRGLVEWIAGKADKFLIHADAILDENPVRECTLTTLPNWGEMIKVAERHIAEGKRSRESLHTVLTDGTIHIRGPSTLQAISCLYPTVQFTMAWQP